MCLLGWLRLYDGTLSASIALRFTQLLHPHEVTTSLLSILAQNRRSLPKSLPWGSLFALDDPITVINLVAPFGSRKRDPRPRVSSTLSRLRYRIDTVCGQLVDRHQVKRVWAKDIWHLNSRLLRKVLSYTIVFLLNQTQGNPPFQLTKLLV